MFAVLGVNASRRDTRDVGRNEVDLIPKCLCHIGLNQNDSEQY